MSSDIDTLKSIREKEKEADKRLREAQEKARQIIEEANKQSSQIVGKAREDGEKYYVDYMNSVKAEIESEIKKIRNENTAKLAKLKREVDSKFVDDLMKIVLG